MGTPVSALGCYLSVYLDLPTGATIVCTFGAIPWLVFFVCQILFRNRNRVAEREQVMAGH